MDRNRNPTNRPHPNETQTEPRTVLTTTESRQGSPRKMNLRVLLVSMVVLAAIGIALTAAYWGSAPENQATQPGPAPAAQSDAPKSDQPSPPARSE